MAAKKYVELKALPEDVRDDMHFRLRRGDASTATARWLQNKGYLASKKLNTLTQTLNRYRKDVVDQDLAERLQESGALDQAKDGSKLDALSEMVFLAQAQKERVSKLMVKEGTMNGLLLKQVTDEMRQNFEFMERVLRMQMEVGIVPRAPKVLAGMVRPGEGGEGFDFVMAQTVAAAADELEELLDGTGGSDEPTYPAA